MKNNEYARNLFTITQVSTGSIKPSAPFSSRQMFLDRRTPDPSSVLRSDRYPIPNFFEYRMRTSE